MKFEKMYKFMNDQNKIVYFKDKQEARKRYKNLIFKGIAMIRPEDLKKSKNNIYYRVNEEII